MVGGTIYLFRLLLYKASGTTRGVQLLNYHHLYCPIGSAGETRGNGPTKVMKLVFFFLKCNILLFWYAPNTDSVLCV